MNFDENDYAAYINATLVDIAKREDIKNVNIVYGNDGAKGDGYLSIVNFIELKGENKSANVIMKTATRDEDVRRKVPIQQSFQAEVVFYDKIVPEFEKFQKDVETPFTGFPKSHAVNGDAYKELVILENLKPKGYVTCDRFKPLDAAHVELVLKEYGKLHAISLAIKNQQPEKYRELAESLGNNMARWFKEGRMIATCKALCERFKPMIEDKVQLERYTKFCDDIENFMYNYNQDDDKFAVITHADCWSNNMLFKYAEETGSKQPIDVKLIDFQISHSTSLIHDIAHMLCTCTDHTIWDKLEYYLNVYHKSLCQFMWKLGSDPIEIMPYATFKKEFEKRCKFGLVISSMFTKVMLIESNEAPDFKDLDENCKVDLGFVKDIHRQNDYDKRILHHINYFYKHNYY